MNRPMSDNRDQRKRVLFYVQQLLDIGHLKGALTLSRSLQASGFDVMIVSGGYNTVMELLATAAGLDAGGADESTRILAESAFAGEQVSA